MNISPEDGFLATVMMRVELIQLAELIGEATRTLDHLAAVGGPEAMVEQVGGLLTNATVVWAMRRVHSGDLTAWQGADMDLVIADARRYASEHPAELAEYDQRRAAFFEQLNKGGLL